MFVGCCLSCVAVRCTLSVVCCCLLCVACRSLSVVRRCVLFVGWLLLFVVQCLV